MGSGRLGSDQGRGATHWVLHPRGAGDDRADVVAHDRDGNIVVAGSFNDRLEGGPLALEGEGPGTVMVAKLRPNGERLWARAFPGGGAFVLALTVDRDRNIVLSGIADGEPIDFGGGPLQGTFLVKLDREGRHLWSKRFFRFPTNALATDSGGHILLAGDITDFPVDFGSGPLSTFADSMGVLVRFDPDGELEWVRGGPSDFRFGHLGVAVDARARHRGRGLRRGGARQPGGGDGELFTTLAMDPRDGVIVTGGYEDRADLGLGPVFGEPSGGNFFVAKYDRIQGDVRWVRTFPSLNATAFDVAAALNGESTVVGFFRAPVDFGSGAVTPTAGSDDLFILRLGK